MFTIWYAFDKYEYDMQGGVQKQVLMKDEKGVFFLMIMESWHEVMPDLYESNQVQTKFNIFPGITF